MRNPPKEIAAFIEELRKFTRPTFRGYLRRIWQRLFPPKTTWPTDGIKIGDIISFNEEPASVISKTGTTVTLDNGSTVTL